MGGPRVHRGVASALNPLFAPPRPQVTDALNRRRNRRGNRLRYDPSLYVDGLLVPRGGSIKARPKSNARVELLMAAASSVATAAAAEVETAEAETA